MNIASSSPFRAVRAQQRAQPLRSRAHGSARTDGAENFEGRTMAGPMSTLIDRLDAAGARRRAAATGPDGRWGNADEFAATLAVLHADHADADAVEADAEPDADDADAGDVEIIGSPLAGIAEVFGLDTTDTALLWLAAASDLDATVGLAYGQLRGIAGTARPTVALGLELAGVPTASAEAFGRLGTEAPLRRHRLIELTETEPWLGRQLRVPDAVLTVLAGGAPADPMVNRIRIELVPLSLPGSATIARAIE